MGNFNFLLVSELPHGPKNNQNLRIKTDPIMVGAGHRRRIYTEAKAKVVAAAWGSELIQFLAALAIFYKGDLKNTRSSSQVRLISS